MGGDFNFILFSPGFDPHSQVILRANDLPQPEQPSQTSSLPAIQFEEAGATRVELKIPPIDYAAVLLLNDQFDPHWNVTIDGQPATLLRANNYARAVHLTGSDKTRVIVFDYHPPMPPAAPRSKRLQAPLCLPVVFIPARISTGRPNRCQAGPETSVLSLAGRDGPMD